MDLVKLHAELQSNPRNQAVYNQLVEHYRDLKMFNEAEAFAELIRKKFHADSPTANQKQ